MENINAEMYYAREVRKIEVQSINFIRLSENLRMDDSKSLVTMVDVCGGLNNEK